KTHVSVACNVAIGSSGLFVGMAGHPAYLSACEHAHHVNRMGSGVGHAARARGVDVADFSNSAVPNHFLGLDVRRVPPSRTVDGQHRSRLLNEVYDAVRIAQSTGQSLFRKDSSHALTDRRLDDLGPLGRTRSDAQEVEVLVL